CFADVPFCKLKWGRSERLTGADHRIDRIGKLHIDGGDARTVLLEVKRSGQPRFIREAANALARYRESFKNAYGIVVAPFISNTSCEILMAEDIGYVDLAGNCRISFDGIYIRKEGKSNQFTE